MFCQKILTPILNNILTFSDRNAFFIRGAYYSYRQLGRRVAGILNHLGNIYENRIGLVINDDLSTYASIIALWLDGKCYVPLHPEWPMARCLEICEQVGLNYILDSSEITKYSSVNVISTKDSDAESLLFPKNDISDNEQAYILFTSSTTGKPKGVPISRKNVATFASALFDFLPDIDENDRCLQCFDLSFDNSVLSYLVPLLKGACMFTVPYGVIKYNYISELLEDYELTFSYMVPSTIDFLRPYFSELLLPKLRYSLFAGGPLYADVAKEWHECIPNAKLFCCYGPTETTVIMSYYLCKKGVINKSHNGIISLGSCMNGMEVMILEENSDEELRQGETGEICIWGNQVFSGYLNDDKRNKKCFVNKYGKKWYRSGDLGYIDETGDIMFVGRKDFQVKIQGYRVELGEIEFHARKFLKKQNVVCTPSCDSRGISILNLYIESREFDTKQLLQYLREKMPSYMIPSKVIFEEHFPMNQNGKVDMNKLTSTVHSNLKLRHASIRDADFIVEVIVAAEKCGTEVFGLARLFDTTEEEMREYIKDMLAEEIDGCEFSLERFIIAEYEGNPVAAFCGWIECGNEDNMPSSLLKANLINHCIPKEKILTSMAKSDIISSLQIEREEGTYQLEYAYTKNEFRKQGIMKKIINMHISEIQQSSVSVKKLQVHVYENNITAIKAYESCGFAVKKHYRTKDKLALKYFPCDVNILMEKTINIQ